MPKTKTDPATYTKPSDGAPLYGAQTGYGKYQRPVRRCLACSSPESVFYVTDDEVSLREHHDSHVKAYAEWKTEEES